MRRILILLALLITGICASAQTTAVTLQVTDTPDAQTWNNGTYFVNFVTPPSSTVLPPAPQSGALSATGGASLTMTRNTNVPGSFWTFSVCSQATTDCYRLPVTISGASQTVTLNPPSIRINGSTLTPTTLAYADAEIVNPPLAASYYNVSLGQQRQWNGTQWAASGGGGAPAYGPVITATSKGVLANGKYIPDATITNGGSIVTCPNTPCNFTAADVGKIIFGTTGSPGGVNQVLSLPQGTILSLNNANSINVSSTGNANVTGLEWIFYGSDDTTAMKATETAALSTCPVPGIVLPAGLIFMQKGWMVSPQPIPCTTGVTAAAAISGVQVNGQGPGNTLIIVTPNFDYTAGSCPAQTNVPVSGCFFTTPGVSEINNITIWGGNNNQTGVAHGGTAIIAVTLDTHLRQVNCLGLGGAANNLIGMYVGGGIGNLITSDVQYNQVVVDGCGDTGIEVDAPSTGFFNVVAANNGGTLSRNLYVTANGILNQHGGFYGPSGGVGSNNVWVDGTANFFGVTNLVSSGNLYWARKNSTLNLFGDSPLIGSLSCIRVGQASQVFAAGTQCAATSSLVLESGGTYVDGGGNRYTNPIVQPAVTQTVQGTPVGSGTTATAQITGVPGGTLIVAYTIFGPAGNTIAGGGCTDTFGTTLTQLGTTQTTTTTNGTAVQFAVFTGTTNQTLVQLGGNDTITCNYTGSVSAPGAVVTALQIAGQDPTPIDQSVNGSGATTAVSAGPLTTNYANELMLLVGGQNISSATFTHGTGYVTNNQGTFLFAENGLFAINTATTATGTEATVGDWAAKLIAIKPNLSAITQQLSASRASQVASNIALTSGWGTSVVSQVRGNSVIQNFVITNSVTGTASPVLTVTFPTNYLVPPSCTITQTSGTFRLSNPTFVTTNSNVAITFTGTPTSPDVYGFRLECD